MTVPRSMLRCMDTKTKETSQQISSGGMAIIGVQQAIIGVQHPLTGHKPGEPPRSETRFARLGAAGRIAHPLTSLRSCLSSTATGASPLSLAPLGYVFSAAAFRPARRAIIGVQHPLRQQSCRSLPAHPRFARSTLLGRCVQAGEAAEGPGTAVGEAGNGRGIDVSEKRS